MSEAQNTAASRSDPDGPQSIMSITDLIEQRGTVPFLGMNAAADAEYPDAVNAIGRRYVHDEADGQTFKEALNVLPHAGEGELWADNEFVTPQDDGSVEVDLASLRDVHGLDPSDLEQKAGMSLEEMVAQANPEPLIRVSTNKDIIDRRRLALRTLGFDCKFRWQIASDRYDPGNMREFFKRKIAACEKHGAQNAFGWIRHHDWGGSVTITTIYPSKAYDVGFPDDADIDFDHEKLTVADDPTAKAFDEVDAGNEDTLTVYYGDRMGYDFRGTQKLWAKPVIYVPAVDTMIPMPYKGADFSRKHTGDLMEDAIPWHEKILSKIDDLCEPINQNIIRARLVALDFGRVPFSVEDFYSYLGIPGDYAEQAADRATALASSSGFDCPASGCDSVFESKPDLTAHHASEHGKELDDLRDALEPHQFPHPVPTLWNLQLSLKLSILDNYEGSKAGKTYREYQEVAGQILQYPATQIQTAIEQHQYEQDEDDTDEDLIDEEQQTLAESLNDVMDITGVTENELDVSDAQQIESRVQQRLPGGD